MDERRRSSDEWVLRLQEDVSRTQETVARLAATVAETTAKSVETSTNITWVRAALARVETLVEPVRSSMTSMERRVQLLERAMFGLIAVIVLAVITAWLQGVLKTP